MVIFRFFGQSCLTLELSTFLVHEMLIERNKEDIKRIFEEEIDHNLTLVSFPR